MPHSPPTAESTARRRPAPWWEWPTILSLDAPAVALLWQWMLARSLHAAVLPQHAFVLGSSVWLSYVADRWIEGWRLARARTRRHLFYQRWRWPVAAAWLMVFGADVGVAILRLGTAEFGAGLLLLGCVLMYLISHQLVHRNRRWRAPKEVCVAVLMGGGAVLFPLSRSPASPWAVLAPLGLFMLLCFVNCVLISAWESDIDRTHGETSIALQFRGGAAFGAAAPWVLAALALILSGIAAAGPPRAAALCAAASSVLLGLINLIERRIGRRLARVLADVALMTPAAPLLGSLLR